MRFTSSLLVALLLTAGAPRTFLSGYAGSLPSDSKDRARTYFDMPAVRALLAELERGPVTRPRAEAILAGGGATVDDLLRVSILRRDGDRYAIGFAYFTADDMRRVHAVANRLVPSLVASYRRHAGEFDRIFAGYSARSVPRRDLAFVVIAGIGLNWDGLALTKELGYRDPILVTGDGFRYSFWASEAVPGRSYREMYWGSSTVPWSDWSFSSFGDAESDPRMNFPDLAFMDEAEMSPRVRAAAQCVGLGPSDAFGHHFAHVLGTETLARAAHLLFALRTRPATADDPKPLLALLEEIEYVKRQDDGRYALKVPVLDERDRPMLERALALNRRIVREWLTKHDAEIRRDLAGLTALRAGLPFEALFTQVWHELFGVATRELARGGIIAKPSKGSLSMLWRSSLYRFIPG